MKCWEFCLYEFNIGILKHMFIIDRKKIKVLNFFLCDLIFFNDKYTSHLSQTRSLPNMLTSSYYHIVGQITHGLVCLKWQGIWCKYHPLICEVASGSLIKMLVNPNLINENTALPGLQCFTRQWYEYHIVLPQFQLLRYGVVSTPHLCSIKKSRGWRTGETDQ